MSMPRQLYLALYDIRDARRLRRALRIVRGYATGGQKSVHECPLTAAERECLLAAMEELLATEEDRFALVPVDPRRRPTTLGIAVPPLNPECIYIA